MNYDTYFYFYSTIAQTLSGLFGFLMVIVLYRYQKLESEGRERTTTAKKLLGLFRMCLISTLLTIVFCLYMLVSMKVHSATFNGYASNIVLWFTTWNLTTYYRATEQIFISADLFMNKIHDEPSKKGPFDIEERK